MFARLVLICAGIVLLPSALIAQDAPAAVPPATPAASAAPLTRADLDAVAKQIEDNVAKRLENSLGQALREQGSRISKLEEQIGKLDDKVKNLSDFQQGAQQELEQIAKKDNSGKSYLRIDASHEPTRNELRRAIIDSAPKTGTVIIRNKMNTDEPVAINGKTYDVLAKSEREVSVEYGSFCVKLRGQARQTRNFNYPNTETVISVVPETQQWVSASPGYWTYVSQ